ncbi:MAG: ADP-ribosylglycohydrolase family protein, partial [Armatimonadota bacterium]
MKPIQISREEYRDKVYACWLGKNIGGTLGMPYECNKAKQSLTFYDPLPEDSAPNDDLDMQIVWLQMMRERGLYPTLTDFSEYWIKHLSPYPWCEYGFCRRNFERGLRPPMSGAFENYFIDEMGSPIRSEIWACVAPGDPQLAAALSWNDAVLDHA